MEKRIGSQTPTQSLVLPYTKTYGELAIGLYNSTGNNAREWQERLIYDILSYNDENLWIHTKFGYGVPRRNGRGEILAIRELWGLKEGEHIMHTAHLTSTSHAAWERLYDLCEKANLNITSSYRAHGKEHIEIDGKGKIEFRTRTSRGGLGEGYATKGELDIVKRGQMVVVQDRLHFLITKSLNQGFVSEYEFQIITNLFEAYKLAGGNSFIKELYERVEKIPIKK